MGWAAWRGAEVRGCMQAVSEAIVKGDCMNSEAISRVLTEAGADFNAYSTCGMTAEAIIKE